MVLWLVALLTPHAPPDVRTWAALRHRPGTAPAWAPTQASPKHATPRMGQRLLATPGRMQRDDAAVNVWGVR